ncbi:MAG: endonuclease/exonuclease/phosphatase family protein [Negativicutes bacterium]|nr:endonuclease/exonuclease/phosphatase family protein [Negativicutes bacterium]
MTLGKSTFAAGILMLGLLAVLAAAAGTAAAYPAGKITVMTFNLRYQSADDKNNSWPYRQDIVVHTIEKYSPDLLGTQECMLGQADFILRNCPAYYLYGIGREASGFGEMSAQFYNKGLFTPVAAGTFWLSETPDQPGSKSWGSACPRIVSWLKIRHLPSGKYLYWFNTHFDHISEQARQQAARLMLEKISEIAGSAPTVITGDFNSTDRDLAWQVFADGGFSDAFSTAVTTAGPVNTFHDFMRAAPGEPNRIDWILTRGVTGVDYYEVVDYNDNGFYPSDHYPVYAVISL